MVLAVRSAQADDAEKLIDFLVAFNGRDQKPMAENYVHAMFSDSFRKPYFVIALDGTDLIGAIAYSEEIFATNLWGLSWVSINEKSRHKGIRQYLVEECLRQIERKVQNSVIVILASAPNKVAFYETLGFKAQGTGEEGRRFMSYILRKSLH